MTYFKTTQKIVYSAVALTMLAFAPGAIAQENSSADEQIGVFTSLPQPQHAGNVTFITGGIGDEERAALQQSKKSYNLYVTSAGSNGDFEGDTHLTIRDKNGDAVVSAVSGPRFYAKLPAGSYVVEATSGDQTIKRNITVGASHSANIDLRWKA